jgi:hypothetical protein
MYKQQFSWSIKQRRNKMVSKELKDCLHKAKELYSKGTWAIYMGLNHLNHAEQLDLGCQKLNEGLHLVEKAFYMLRDKLEEKVEQ